MEYTIEMKKDELVAAVGLYMRAGVEFIAQGDDGKLRSPDDLTKAELVGWLSVQKEKLGDPIEVTAEFIAENPEVASKFKLGDVMLNPPKPSEPVPPVPHVPTAPQAPAMRAPTATQVRSAAKLLYFHGVKIHKINDQIISGRIYKDITLENGTGYKITLEEFEKNVTDHA